MASDGSAPAPGAGQMKYTKKITLALCFALMITLIVCDEVGACGDDAHAKPTFMLLPMRLRNPRGVGLSHQGAGTSDPAHLPEVHDPREAGQFDSVPEDHGSTFQDDNSGPRFAHLPQHNHDSRGAHLPRPTDQEVNVDSGSENQVESANPEVHRVRFSHLPRLHNPRGVQAVKQIQESMSEESGRQAGDKGDKN